MPVCVCVCVCVDGGVVIDFGEVDGFFPGVCGGFGACQGGDPGCGGPDVVVWKTGQCDRWFVVSKYGEGGVEGGGGGGGLSERLE